jgi:hypothetical protein
VLNGTNFVLGCKSIYIRYRTKYVSVIRPFRLISPLFNKPSSCPLCVNSAYELVRYSHELSSRIGSLFTRIGLTNWFVIRTNSAHELVRFTNSPLSHEM